MRYALVTLYEHYEVPLFIVENGLGAVDILKKDPNAKIVPNFLTEHEDFEASQWPVFLPKLYDLWKNHPDPSQNVQCCLEVEKTAEGWRYIKENGPVVL